MPSPNLNALRMFEAAARHLNFRLAAEELHVTQGAVAQQIRRLEVDLGCKLFHRRARGLELTDIGRNYFIPVKRALGIINDATSKLRPANTTLKISVTPSFAAKWLVPRLSAFEQAHPGIDVQTTATEGLADFKTDRIDLAIRQGTPPFGEHLHVEQLAPLLLCAVCSPKFADNLGAIQSLEQLASSRLIQDSHNHWDRQLEEAGYRAESDKLQFNQTALTIEAAINGQGIALVPWLLAEAEIKQRKLVKVWQGKATDQGGFYFISPEIPKPKSAVMTMIAWCKTQASEPPA